MSNKQTMSFQTEIKQLLNLMIHSLYSDKEIFLRELVSNASDAIDKFRFLQVSQPELNKGAELAVEISFDKDAKTITVSDNGVGMASDELEKLILNDYKDVQNFWNDLHSNGVDIYSTDSFFKNLKWNPSINIYRRVSLKNYIEVNGE